MAIIGFVARRRRRATLLLIHEHGNLFHKGTRPIHCVDTFVGMQGRRHRQFLLCLLLLHEQGDLLHEFARLLLLDTFTGPRAFRSAVNVLAR